jgi:hypothetical protein
MRNLPILLLTLAVAITAAACGDSGRSDRGAASEAIGGSSTQPGGAQSNSATYPTSTTFGSACQAAADAASTCSEAYMTAMEMERPALPEIPPSCTDDASTDAMYDCIAAAYDAGDCASLNGMSAAAIAAGDCGPPADDDDAGDDAADDDAADE